MVTSTGLLSSIPAGTSTRLVVGLMSIVHGPSLMGFALTVRRLSADADTPVGTFGQELLPNVTTYIRPASAQTAWASNAELLVAFGGNPLMMVTDGNGVAAKAGDAGAELGIGAVVVDGTLGLELVEQPQRR